MNQTKILLEKPVLQSIAVSVLTFCLKSWMLLGGKTAKPTVEVGIGFRLFRQDYHSYSWFSPEPGLKVSY